MSGQRLPWQVAPSTLGAVLVLGCGAFLACGADESGPEIAAPPVLVKRAQAQTLSDRIQATGQLLAKDDATVAAQVGGQVTGVAADEGAGVEHDQMIVAIDPERRELEVKNTTAGVVQAEAQLEEARREAGRIQRLVGRGAASQSRVDEATTQLDLARSRLVAAQAQLGLAQRALDDANVCAPFSGLVARRYVNVGEFVNVGDPLFDLVALDPVEVEFYLAEIDSPRVALGQTVEVRTATYPDDVFAAEVNVVSPTIDPSTRTRRVKAVLANPEGKLLPGTFARVNLGVAERSNVVMIPKEAVLQRADGAVVFRLTGVDRVERLRVQTGVFRGDLVELRGNVVPGDWIVVRGQTALIDGAAVSLRNEDGSAMSEAALGTHAARQGG